MEKISTSDGFPRNGDTNKIPEKAKAYMTHRICPICNHHFIASDYLVEILADDPKARFIANMVTHYRHNHIAYWNRCWGRNGDYYRKNWFGDYEEEKQKANERAKRQIIRKAQPILLALGITSDTFKSLQNTDEKTIALAVGKLDKNINVKTQ